MGRLFSLRQLSLGMAIGVFAQNTMADTHAAHFNAVPEKYQYCTVCHGTQLKGNPGTQAPRLSHLPAWYIETQLDAFKKGWRGLHPDDISGHEMRAAAEKVSLDDLSDTATFASSTQSAAPQPSEKGDAEAGKQLFASCAACHGSNAEGNEAMKAPPLDGQNGWYLVKQLNNFKQGVRGNHPKDSQGAMMRAAAATLTTPQAITDVVSYIQQLPKPE